MIGELFKILYTVVISYKPQGHSGLLGCGKISLVVGYNF